VEAFIPKVLGIFSRRIDSEIGTGSTTGRRENITYWFARQAKAGQVEVQPLTVAGLPSGIVKRLSTADFLRNHYPEPLYYRENPSEMLEALAGKLLGRSPGGLASLDAGESKGLAALAGPRPQGQGEALEGWLREAREVLETLICSSPAVVQEQRVSLNRFAISLRKDGLYDESIDFYSKAVELEKNDEHLFFNMARVYYDKGDLDGCRGALEQALAINPEFSEAGRFRSYLSRKRQGGI